jgi:amidohydrolase
MHRQLTKEEFDYAVHFRRDLHTHPELRFAEYRTSEKIASEAEQLGLKVTRGVAETGVIVEWESGKPGPHVLLRADLDALPVPDLKDVKYRSLNEGIMHACGHDVHMTVVMTIARLIAERPPTKGRISFLFQPAEEIPFGEASGAQAILDSGQFKRLNPDYVLGLHCWPTLDAGKIGIDQQIAMAAKDAFSIKITGRGAHAATPELGIDSILVASQVVSELHHLISRRVNPADSAALNVGTIHGGHSQSVLADEVEITGTIRTISAETRTGLRLAITRLAEGVATSSGAQIKVVWANEMPAVVNNQNLVAISKKVFGGVLGLENVIELSEPPMTTDDFALYAEKVPGLYIKLGVGSNYPLHSSNFDVDEECLRHGIEALHELVFELISK